jgi:uncharacterized membrane protein
VPFDVLGVWLESPFWWAAAYWNIIVALLAAIPTVLFGLTDYAAYVRGERPERLALLHMIVILSALGMFALSIVCRSPEPNYSVPRLVPLIFDCLGMLLVAVGGWFGGELVYGHGIGMRKNLDVHREFVDVKENSN